MFSNESLRSHRDSKFFLASGMVNTKDKVLIFLSTSAYGEKILISCNSAEKEDMAICTFKEIFELAVDMHSIV